jgi:CubicO group peptidase (beta-lactamase class C family)
VRRFLRDNDLKAAIVQVDIADRRLVTTAAGESMAGVPATSQMHFRIGAMSVPYLIDVLLQLRDEGRLSLDDRVSRWLPELPMANRITLRMLASHTSGYLDYLGGNKAMIDAIYSNPFRQWKPQELLDAAFRLGKACDPGVCFKYAHTNFVVLSKVLRLVTGQPVARLIRRRFFGPLGLKDTQISALPRIPAPVLHAYDAERGVYEDSTFWSPSFTIGEGTIMTSTVADIAKSARAVGTGRLVSKRALREMLAPVPVSMPFPAFNKDLYYGLGIIVSRGWQLQNPQLFGFTGVMGYLPSRRTSIALTTTMGKTAAEQNTEGVNFSENLFTELADYLAPDNHPVFP